MITKRVPMNQAAKSSFGRLVKYLTDDQQKEERVGEIRITNCQSEVPEWASLEVETTQKLNRRATSDRTYHLLISFPEGERPSQDVLQDIEDRMCEALGYGEHQRISVAHQDTDNFHIHVAINKIHPERLTMHEPYRDYRSRDEMCVALEEKHNLQRVNHKQRRTRAEGRAQDMENVAGRESLLSWVRKHCAEAVKEAETWQQLHETIAKYDVALVEQGAGLAFKSSSGVVVKASTVNRDFSKATLQKRLGSYRAVDGKLPEPEMRYEGMPVQQNTHSAELFAEYSTARSEGLTLRSKALDGAMGRRDELMAAARRSANLKRQALKTLARGKIAKRLVYMRINRTLQNELKKIRQDHARERKKIYEKHQRPAWNDWLKQQAEQGNDKALQVLRARRKVPAPGNSIGLAEGSKEGRAPGIKIDGVTKKGTVVYRLHGQSVRDDGQRLQLSPKSTNKTLLAAMSLARLRYGQELTLAGSEAFRARAASLAGRHGLAVTFTDPAAEKLRQTTDKPTKKEIKDGQRAIRKPGTGAARKPGGRKPGGSTAQPGRGGQGLGKRSVGGIGRKPTSQPENRLYGVSELSVVRIGQRTEMLLQGDARRHLDEQGAKRTDSLRRPVPGGRGIEAERAEKYVTEREAKRLKGFDIPEHRRYDFEQGGTFTYQGTRQVEGQKLALMKKGETVHVLPVDDKTANRLKRVKVGDNVTVDGNRTVRTKGRTR